ncbi:hypothetical protein [Streptomyces daliensis]
MKAMKALTLRDLSAPVTVLARLLADHGSLPAPHFDASPIYPDRLTLAIHDDPLAAAMWMETLSIPAGALVVRTHNPGRSRVEQATIRMGAAEVRFQSFVDIRGVRGGGR